MKCWFLKFDDIFSYLPPHRMSIYQFCFFVQRYCCILFLWNVKWWIARNPCPLMHSAAFYTPVSHFTKIKSNRIVGQKKILITTWNAAVYVDRKIQTHPPQNGHLQKKPFFTSWAKPKTQGEKALILKLSAGLGSSKRVLKIIVGVVVFACLVIFCFRASPMDCQFANFVFFVPRYC